MLLKCLENFTSKTILTYGSFVGNYFDSNFKVSDRYKSIQILSFILCHILMFYFLSNLFISMSFIDKLSIDSSNLLA